MKARLFLYGGLAFAIVIAVVVFRSPPEALPSVLRPLGIFLFMLTALIYSPALIDLFRWRGPISGGSMLGSAAFMLAAALGIPTLRLLWGTSCMVYTTCWQAFGAFEIGAIAFTLALIISAPIVGARNGTAISLRWLLTSVVVSAVVAALIGYYVN